MNVVQNYLFTVMHGDFSLYEVRLFVCIVKHANQALRGTQVKNYLGTQVSCDGITAHMKIKITDILSDGAHDYNIVRNAARTLQDKVIEYYDKSQKKWIYHRDHLINNVEHKDGDGYIKFDVSVWLLKFIMNFINNNFSQYDFEKCFTIKSSYAIRMYWLTCSMKNPCNYTIKMLKDMFGVSDKYKQNRDFIKRCIDIPMHELERLGLNGYQYKKIGRGDKAYLHFIPVKRQIENRNQVMATQPANLWVPFEVRNYLKSNAGFDNESFAKNKATLFDFCQIKGYRDILVRIVQHSRVKRAGIGYIINAMKSEIRQNKVLNNEKS